MMMILLVMQLVMTHDEENVMVAVKLKVAKLVFGLLDWAELYSSVIHCSSSISNIYHEDDCDDDCEVVRVMMMMMMMMMMMTSLIFGMSIPINNGPLKVPAIGPQECLSPSAEW